MVRTRLNIGCRYSTPVLERPLHPTRSQFKPQPSQTQAPVTPATEPERRAGGGLTTINAHLASRGHRLRTGTIVDASIIDAPSSTKNRRRARDPEMHQTRKGKQWYFGMKAHIGVDAGSGLAHSLTTTAANASDVTQAGALLHGAETTAWGDAGYQGVEKRPEHRDGGVEWRVAMKPGRRRLLAESGAEEAAEKRKASVRAKVEHPFLYVKRHFGYAKVRYRGVAKNRQRIVLLLGFSNLLIAGRYATG